MLMRPECFFLVKELVLHLASALAVIVTVVA